MKRRIIKIICVVLFMTLLLYLLQRLLMPKYMSDVVEGAMIAEYYNEKKDHDIVMIGDCEIYENFSPVVLWEDYGINCYIRGSAQQLIWQSYYLMEETLRYEKPDVIVFNVLSMKYNEPQNEAYNRMTLDGMRWSSSKINSIRASLTDEESMIEYLFPILRYHSRWSDLTAEDFKYIFTRDQVTHNGYYMRVDVKGVNPEEVPAGKPMSQYQFGENAYYYLDKMVELCRREGVELVLIKAPSLYPYWYDEWENQMETYANDNQLTYINYLELIDEVGLDFLTDTYDMGLHLNLSGAEKLSRYFGQQMVDLYGLEDRRNESELVLDWETKIEFYNSMRDDQYKELEQYGELIHY